MELKESSPLGLGWNEWNFEFTVDADVWSDGWLNSVAFDRHDPSPFKRYWTKALPKGNVEIREPRDCGRLTLSDLVSEGALWLVKDILLYDEALRKGENAVHERGRELGLLLVEGLEELVVGLAEVVVGPAFQLGDGLGAPVAELGALTGHGGGDLLRALHGGVLRRGLGRDAALGRLLVLRLPEEVVEHGRGYFGGRRLLPACGFLGLPPDS